MKQPHFYIPLLLLFTSPLVGCVSVRLQNSTPLPASQTIRWKAPPAPFFERKDAFSQAHWHNRDDNTTLSLFSECGGEVDPELVLTEITATEVISRSQSTFQNRPAWDQTIIARWEGVPVLVRQRALNKKGCLYLFTATGAPTQQDQTELIFQNFLTGVEIP